MLICMHKDDDPRIRLEAVHRLGKFGHIPATVRPAIVDALGDVDKKVREVAQRSLYELDTDVSAKVF